MTHPQLESLGGTPQPLPWEAWRHASDGVAIVSPIDGAVVASNTAFERICQAHDLIPATLIEKLLPEFPDLRHDALVWRDIDSLAGGAFRIGLLRWQAEPTTVLVMIPPPADCPDIVTGLADRRRLENELEARFFSGRPFALLFVDLDGFKQVNDDLGHVAGDLALREIAQRMRGSLRERDIVGRYGGDEFIVLLDGAVQAQDLTLIVERIENAAAEPLESVTGAGPLSASIGWAFSSDGYEGPAEMLSAADRRMYASKRQEC